jgi:hypothetical protein
MIRKVPRDGHKFIQIMLTEEDLADLKKLGFPTRYIKTPDVFPNGIYEVIARSGHKGSWIIRNMRDLRWYHTTNLKRYAPYDDYCPDVKLIFTGGEKK